MHMSRQHPPLKITADYYCSDPARVDSQGSAATWEKDPMLNHILGLAYIRDNTNAKALDPPTSLHCKFLRRVAPLDYPNLWRVSPAPLGNGPSQSSPQTIRTKPKSYEANPSPHPSLRLTNCEKAGGAVDVPRRVRGGRYGTFELEKGNCVYPTVAKSIPLHPIHT